MKLLAIGHSLVIDTNRKFWSTFSKVNHATVDMIAPLKWSSNLSKTVPFNFNPITDSGIRNIYPTKVFFKGNGSLFFFEPFKLFRILTKEKYDFIYLNQENWALSTLIVIICKLFTKNRNTKLLLCVAQNLKKEKFRFLHPYEKMLSSFISAYLYCSEEVKDVISWKGISKKCIYFPLPYDEDIYKNEIKDSPNEVFQIGYLGRISEDKGIKILLEALDSLAQKKKNFKFIIGGNGPLVELVKTKKYVTYLGLIPHNQAYQFYQKIDCFILPSQTRRNWKEQFGRVIVESFGAGKPVIGSSSGSIPEVLGKLQWPWIFNENDSSELAEHILKLESSLKTDLGIKNLNKSIELNQQQFSQKRVAENLLKDICSL